MKKKIICSNCGAIAPADHKKGCKHKWMTNYGRDFIHNQVYDIDTVKMIRGPIKR